MKDKEELKKIMRGQFRRKHENDEMVEEMEEHQREKRKRMDEFQ